MQLLNHRTEGGPVCQVGVWLRSPLSWQVITNQHPYHLYTLLLPTSLVMANTSVLVPAGIPQVIRSVQEPSNLLQDYQLQCNIEKVRDPPIFSILCGCMVPATILSWGGHIFFNFYHIAIERHERRSCPKLQASWKDEGQCCLWSFSSFLEILNCPFVNVGCILVVTRLRPIHDYLLVLLSDNVSVSRLDPCQVKVNQKFSIPSLFQTWKELLKPEFLPGL